MSAEERAEFERVARDHNVQCLTPLLLQYAKQRSEPIDLVFSRDLHLACMVFADTMLRRDDAPRLKASFDKLGKIEEALGFLSREISRLDEFSLEWVKNRGPTNLMMPAADPHLIEKALIDELPRSGCDVAAPASHEDGWVRRLDALSRLVGLTKGSIQSFLGADDAERISQGGRQSLMSLSMAHPKWALIYDLCSCLSDWQHHDFRTKKGDCELLQNFVSDVLIFKFPGLVLDLGDSINKFFHCVSRIRDLITKIGEIDKRIQQSSGSRVDPREHRSLRNQRNVYQGQLDVQQLFLIRGPERKPRGNPVEILARIPHPEHNLNQMHVVVPWKNRCLAN